jgi:hypothetical protein
MSAAEDLEKYSYPTIKKYVLETFFNGCRDHRSPKDWNHKQILAFLFDYYDGAYDDDPVEDLMWRVVFVGLMGGWYPEWEIEIRKTISALLAENPLEEVIANLPTNEGEEFAFDLRVLNFI